MPNMQIIYPVPELGEQQLADDDTAAANARLENVQNFLSAAVTMGVPAEYMLSLPDLDADAADDTRPRVADCILWLKRLHGGGAAAMASPAAQGPLASNRGTSLLLDNPVSPPTMATGLGTQVPAGSSAVDSPRRLAHTTMMRALHRTAAVSAGPSPSSVSHSSVGHPTPPLPPRPQPMLSDHISVLQGMSSMLREKMGFNASHTSASVNGTAPPPDAMARTTSLRSSHATGLAGHGNSSHYGHAMDAMGPVLENVLGNLTQVKKILQHLCHSVRCMLGNCQCG
jgi:hypothetical protein